MFSESYAAGPRNEPLLEGTIGEHLERLCTRHSSREALVVRHQGYRASYARLWAEVDVAARALLGLGVKKGERVGIWSPNRFEWVILQFATARVGAILVNVNPAYRSAELKYVLNQSGISLLFMARAFRQASYVAFLAEVKGECPVLKRAIVLDDEWGSLAGVAAQVAESQLEDREGELHADDAINIQYTSGTTGFPKGATLTHRNILNNGWFVGERLRYTHKDRICIPVPFYHCFGMVLGNLAGLTHGACLVIPGESFEPGAALEAVQAERCTSLYGVPTMFIAELEHPELSHYDVSSLRTGIMAGAPCPFPVMERVRSQLNLTEITICYGMTETSPVSTQTLTTDPPDLQCSTVGTVHPHVEVKIIDEEGKTVPRGEKGELCTRGYSVMKGYWNDPRATAESIDKEGWMHSGDLASMDTQGYVRIEGRLKDMIIRGGENIYPKEVEEFLIQHPLVAEAQVVGVPSEKYGEEVFAWIKLKSGASLDGQKLADYCRGKIATYKIPRYWRFVDAFPLTVTGKVQKFRLRELGAEEAKKEK